MPHNYASEATPLQSNKEFQTTHERILVRSSSGRCVEDCPALHPTLVTVLSKKTELPPPMVFSKTVSSSFLEDSTMVDASRKKCEMTYDSLLGIDMRPERVEGF